MRAFCRSLVQTRSKSTDRMQHDQGVWRFCTTKMFKDARYETGFFNAGNSAFFIKFLLVICPPGCRRCHSFNIQLSGQPCASMHADVRHFIRLHHIHHGRPIRVHGYRHLIPEIFHAADGEVSDIAYKLGLTAKFPQQPGYRLPINN